ncbi:MAG: hypothetical protein WDA74_03290 [Spirochaetota bacterium]
MKKIYALLIIVLLAFSGCFDDGDSDGPKGTLEVKVNTSDIIWGYPKIDPNTENDCFRDSTNAKNFGYPLVGGENEATKAIEESGKKPQVGDKINIVYLYSELGEQSDYKPVLYKGTASNNNSIVSITGVVTGEYYVVAFYDYRKGGNQENLMNRYDRYAIYTDSSNAEIGTSTPFADKAAKITISEDQTTSITLDIHENWILGKPKVKEGDTGRIFLQEADGIPTPGDPTP